MRFNSCVCVFFIPRGSRGLKPWFVTSISHMGEMRDADWSRPHLLRSDWLGPQVALYTTLNNVLLLLSLKGDSKGAFHSTQNSGNFGWLIKWKGPFRFGPTGIFGTSFEGCPQWPVWTFRSVGPKCAFPFAKIVVPSTALLYPAYKNKYSRLPITRTFKGNRKRFELSGVRRK